MSGRQPIETAPKDGTLVYTWSWDANHHTFWWALKALYNGDQWVTPDGKPFDPQPTHWDFI